MTTSPIDRSNAPYTGHVTTGTETTAYADKVQTTGTPTDADLQQIGALASVHTAAGGLTMGDVSPLNAAKAGAALDELSADGGNISDLLASMAATMADLFQKLRKNAMEGKVAELKTQVQAMQGQADKMRDAADNNYNAALIQGWTQFAGGAVGLAGGVVAARASFKAGKEIKAQEPAAAATPAATPKAANTAEEANSFDDLMAQAGTGRERANAFKGERPADAALDSTPEAPTAASPAAPYASGKADLLNSRAKLATELSQSMGSVITGLGGVLSAGKKHDADMDEAQGKELEAQATQAAAHLAREDEFAQMWKEATQRLLDNLKAAYDQEQSSAKATIQNI